MYVPVIQDKEWRAHAHRRKGCYLSGRLLTSPRGWHVTQRSVQVRSFGPTICRKDGRLELLEIGTPISGWSVEEYRLVGNDRFPPEFRNGCIPPYRNPERFCIDMMVFLEPGKPPISPDARRDMVPFPEPHDWHFPIPIRFVQWVFMSHSEFIREMVVELVPLLDEPEPLQ